MLLVTLLSVLATTAAIPFEITNNKTFVQVLVNAAAPQWFIFDTGNNGPSVIDREYADRLKLSRGTEEKVQIGAGSGAPTGLSHLNQPMQLEALGETLTVAEPLVFTLEHVSRVVGRRVKGLMGGGLL